MSNDDPVAGVDRTPRLSDADLSALIGQPDLASYADVVSLAREVAALRARLDAAQEVVRLLAPVMNDGKPWEGPDLIFDGELGQWMRWTWPAESSRSYGEWTPLEVCAPDLHVALAAALSPVPTDPDGEHEWGSCGNAWRNEPHEPHLYGSDEPTYCPGYPVPELTLICDGSGEIGTPTLGDFGGETITPCPGCDACGPVPSEEDGEGQ